MPKESMLKVLILESLYFMVSYFDVCCRNLRASNEIKAATFTGREGVYV